MALVNLFVADGRLGNQLFQLNFIRTLESSNVWLCGYDESIKVINDDRLAGLHILNRWISRLIFCDRGRRLLSGWKPWLERVGIRILSGRGLSAKAQLEKITYAIQYNRERRLLGAVVYLNFTMLGADSYQGVVATHKDNYIREDLRHAAEMWFRKRGLLGEECCFVHVRRGDYACWPSEDMNALLPIRFYRDAIKCIRERTRERNLKILLASDTSLSLESYGGDFAVDENPSLTFAILSLCHHGVMSASTFSLAASFHEYEKKKEGVFMAPMYWGGYNGDVWYPEKDAIYFKEIDYLSKEGMLCSGLGS